MSPTYRHFTGIVVIAAVAIAASWANHGRADAPAGRYTMANGTVYDTKTKLTWEEKIVQLKFNWSAAEMHCMNLGLDGEDWRLPTMKELQTLVDRKRTNPAIDPTAFPNTPPTFFWTSSPWAGMPSTETWTVNFSDGSSSNGSVADESYVRCVKKDK